MSEKNEGATQSRGDVNEGEQIGSLIGSFSGEDRILFEEYIKLPNQPDIQPEAMNLVMRYGKRFSRVTDRVEATRQRLGIHYDDLRRKILDRLEK